MRLAVGVISMFLAATVSAQQLEFKGLRMGASLEELRQLPGLAELKCPIVQDNGDADCWISNPDFRYADQVVKSFSANFLGGKLAELSVATLGGTGDVIEDALKSRYGPVTKRYKVAQTIKNGAPYKMLVREWKIKSGGMISMQDHPAPVNEMFTEMISPEWLAWQKSASKASKKARSDI